MRKFSIFLALLFAALYSQAQFSAKQVRASNGVSIDFYQFTPKDYNDNGRKHPVIIFLHGISERGRGPKDLHKVLNAGLPKFIRTGKTDMRFHHKGRWESFVVLIPQLSTSYGNWQQFYTGEMIEFATKNLNIDPDRIYLTGLSLGGGGVWSYASGSLQQAKKLAAIAPICGTCAISNPDNIAKASLPVWAFHANDDNRVSASCSKNAVNNILRFSPQVTPQLTLWPNGKHNVWDRVYDPKSKWVEPSIYEWFLDQTRGSNQQKPNQAPVARVAADIELTLPENATVLNASASSDADGKISKYYWTKISGPAGFKIHTPNAAETRITGLKEGQYIFRVQVTDNDGETASAEQKVTVIKKKNKLPVAFAGKDQLLTLPDSETIVNGSQSTDSDGKIVSYKWTKVRGNGKAKIQHPNSAVTKISGLVEGEYIFRLTVTDNDKGSASNDLNITVKAKKNEAPTAVITGEDEIRLPDKSVLLSGRSSTDKDGKIKKYQWTKISGPSNYNIANKNNVQTVINKLAEGNYTFRLTVWDDDGASASTDHTVKVLKEVDRNKAPIPKIDAPALFSTQNEFLELRGRGSHDPDGKIVRYEWSQVNGPSTAFIIGPRNVITGVVGLTAGNYQFKLTVWDNKNAEGAAIVNVKVIAALPTASISGPASTTLPINEIELSGRSSTGESKIVRYHWTKISGPDSYLIPGKNNAKTIITNLEEGVYNFRLTVWDKYDQSSYTDHQVTVYPAVASKPSPVQASIAGPDQIQSPETSVVLTGRNSNAANGEIVKYRWSQVSGPDNALILGPNNAKTLIGALVVGTYVFRLEVSDEKGNTASEDFRLAVLAGVRGTSAKSASANAEAVPVAEEIKAGLRLFPNPAKSEITVSLQDQLQGSGSILIYDAAGRIVLKQAINKTSFQWQQQISIASLKTGLYQLEIRIGNSGRKLVRFLKQ